MIDANSQFFAILTNVGMAKQANADALGVPWRLTEMGLGDANPTGVSDPVPPIPNAAQTKLINEWRRRPLNQLRVDPVNPAVIIAEQVIPADEGGKWIREIGLYDADGDLVAVANCAPSFKPLLSQGSGRTQIVRINFQVTSSANITLKIDPAVVLATRKYVDDSIINVLPADKTAGTYTKVTINARGVVTSGSNPTTLEGYGIVDAMPKGAGGLMAVPTIVKGKIADLPATQFVTIADETTDQPAFFTYGSGIHVKFPDQKYGWDIASCANVEWFGMRWINADGSGVWRGLWHEGNFNPQLKADLASPLFSGNVRVPDIAPGTVGQGAANTRFVMDAIAALVASSPAGLDTLKELAAALGNDPNFATTMTNALSGKANLANPVFSGNVRVPDIAPGTVGEGAANTRFVRDAIAALVASSPAALDTLNELAAALGNDPNFATMVTNALAGKAAKATTLGGYGISDAYSVTQLNTLLDGKLDKAGGPLTGPVSIMTAQDVGTPGLRLSNTAYPGAQVALKLETTGTAAYLLHNGGTSGFLARNAAGGYADVDAGLMTSFGSACHTATTFMKPVAGQWISLTGVATLPAGGTWACFIVTVNGSGIPTTCASIILAGGTSLGSIGAFGFAWRIQ